MNTLSTVYGFVAAFEKLTEPSWLVQLACLSVLIKLK